MLSTLGSTSGAVGEFGSEVGRIEEGQMCTLTIHSKSAGTCNNYACILHTCCCCNTENSDQGSTYCTFMCKHTRKHTKV